MKGIKISTKITLLILLLAVITVTAISLFTYDYVIKINQDKFTTNLSVIADNRAAYFNHYFDKAVSSIKILQESETLKSGGVAPAGPTTGNADLTSLTAAPDDESISTPAVTSANPLAEY